MKNKTIKYHWLLIPAFITLFNWFKSRKFIVTDDAKEEASDNAFNAVIWLIVYCLIAFTIIREITYQVPVIIMT